MSEGRGELELYNQWFLLADLDRDGQLSGAEAVQFFQRSGLPQNPTLFKVWQYVAGDRPALNRQQFYTAMKLVSLAQANGGSLDAQQAVRLVNGLAGPVPPPFMEGLVLPTESAPVAPARPVPAPPVAVSAIHRPVGSLDAGATAYPLLSSEQATSFQLAFQQLDTDGDGYAQGVDCFPAFMRSGLPKATLKEVWDVVAGDDGQLSAHQFVQCLYLIECVKRGIAVPKALPSGQFPPVAGTVDLQTVMGAPLQGLYSGPLQMPAMPARAAYLPVPFTQPLAFQSQVPPPAQGAEVMGMVAAERARLDAERQAALQQETLRKQAEEERRAAAARQEFFTSALADLRLTQSKVARALVEAQQRLEMERADADAMENQYNAAYEAFSSEHVRSGPLLEALQAVQQEKAGLSAKLEALRASVAQLENFDPQWEGREQAESEQMRKEIAALTVRKEALELSSRGVQARRDQLEAAIDGLKVAEGAEQEVAALQAEVDNLDPAASKDGAAVVALLRHLAPCYNKLYSAAKAAMVPLPAEALASIARQPSVAFKYDALRHAADAANWDSFQDEGSCIVSALAPDSRLEQLTSASLVAGPAEGVEVAAGGADPPVEDDGTPKAAVDVTPRAAQKESDLADTSLDGKGDDRDQLGAKEHPPKGDAVDNKHSSATSAEGDGGIAEDANVPLASAANSPAVAAGDSTAMSPHTGGAVAGHVDEESGEFAVRFGEAASEPVSEHVSAAKGDVFADAFETGRVLVAGKGAQNGQAAGGKDIPDQKQDGSKAEGGAARSADAAWTAF